MSSRAGNATFFERWSSNLVRAPLFALSTMFYGGLSLAWSPWDESGRRQHALARRWASALLRISNSPVTFIHEERVDGAGERVGGSAAAAVYAVNHLSYMDTPAVYSCLPFQFRILARSDLFDIPFMGWHLRRSGQIPVDASSLRSQVASLNRGVAALKSGMPLVVFPEGGRSEDGALQPFMSGPAWMAIRAQVPLVPLALIGTHELLPMHVYHLRPRPLRLVCGRAIATAGLTNRDVASLTGRLHAAIFAMCREYAYEAAGRPADQGLVPQV